MPGCVSQLGARLRPQRRCLCVDGKSVCLQQPLPMSSASGKRPGGFSAHGASPPLHSSLVQRQKASPLSAFFGPPLPPWFCLLQKTRVNTQRSGNGTFPRNQHSECRRPPQSWPVSRKHSAAHFLQASLWFGSRLRYIPTFKRALSLIFRIQMEGFAVQIFPRCPDIRYCCGGGKWCLERPHRSQGQPRSATKM